MSTTWIRLRDADAVAEVSPEAAASMIAAGQGVEVGAPEAPRHAEDDKADDDEER